jgi:hypothetical protein
VSFSSVLFLSANFFYAAFVVVARADDGASLPFAFLADILSRFFSAYAQEYRGAGEMGLAEFARVLQNRLDHINANQGSVDKIKAVRGEVDKVKTVMLDNIDKGELVVDVLPVMSHNGIMTLLFCSSILS